MTNLVNILNKWGSDKAQLFNDPFWHGYAGVYECLFRRSRQEVEAVLEIGIGTMIPDAHSTMVGWALEGYRPGGSLRAWREYFPNAVIYGIDVQPDTQLVNEERILTFICDSTDTARVRELMTNTIGSEFDLIIDDGSHIAADQVATMRNFFPHLRQNGIYVVEDIVENEFDMHLETIKEEICHGNPCFMMGSGCRFFAAMRIV